jgi:capsular exopolysaccharide synthesis family protein
MSRIHEALKRAEQERAAGHNVQNGEDLAEPSAANEVVQAGVTPPNILAPALVPQVRTETLPEVLRVEELWAKCARPQWKPDPNLLVFGNSNPFNPGTEQFRTLRSRLYKIRESQPLHVLLITSAIPAEGKTLVATNLAHAMVRQRGCRVLLIDADLRSPRIHSLLGAPATPGLADYLQGGANEFEVIQRGHEEGLCFIPAGNHVTHPSELISSSRMKQFFERVKPAFDWIIVDSPPALPVADASVLGGICDGVLLVVRANVTPSEAAQKACRELRDTNVIGVVLNTVEEAVEYGSYYTYRADMLAHSKDSYK